MTSAPRAVSAVNPLKYLSLSLSVLLLFLALVLFVSAQWWNWGHLTRIDAVTAAVVLPLVLSALVTKPNGRRFFLTLAVLFMGGLLALVGQTFQSGADSWELFAIWWVLGLPLVAVAKTTFLDVFSFLLSILGVGLFFHQRWWPHIPHEDIWRWSTMGPALWAALFFGAHVAFDALGLQESPVAKRFAKLAVLGAIVALSIWSSIGVFDFWMILLRHHEHGGVSILLSIGFSVALLGWSFFKKKSMGWAFLGYLGLLSHWNTVLSWALWDRSFSSGIEVFAFRLFAHAAFGLIGPGLLFRKIWALNAGPPPPPPMPSDVENYGEGISPEARSKWIHIVIENVISFMIGIGIYIGCSIPATILGATLGWSAGALVSGVLLLGIAYVMDLAQAKGAAKVNFGVATVMMVLAGESAIVSAWVQIVNASVAFGALVVLFLQAGLLFLYKNYAVRATCVPVMVLSFLAVIEDAGRHDSHWDNPLWFALCSGIALTIWGVGQSQERWKKRPEWDLLPLTALGLLVVAVGFSDGWDVWARYEPFDLNHWLRRSSQVSFGVFPACVLLALKWKGRPPPSREAEGALLVCLVLGLVLPMPVASLGLLFLIAGVWEGRWSWCVLGGVALLGAFVHFHMTLSVPLVVRSVLALGMGLTVLVGVLAAHKLVPHTSSLVQHKKGLALHWSWQVALGLGVAEGIGVRWEAQNLSETALTAPRVRVQLAPRDPRSLMQGDYMALATVLARKIQADPQFEALAAAGKGGWACVRKGEHDAAELEAVSEDRGALATDCLALKWWPVPSWGDRPVPRFGADDWFFPEGKAKSLEKATWGVLAIGANGKSILVGLEDESHQVLAQIAPPR